jgi:hypothetical protein
LNITVSQLRAIITDCKGAKFASIVTETDQALTGGKSCPYKDRVTKIAKVSGMINWLYENAVNNQRDREGQPITNLGEVEQFIAEPRAWGKRLHLSTEKKPLLLPFVHHVKGTKRDGQSHRIVTMEELTAIPDEELYLEFKPHASMEYSYFLDGKPIDQKMIEAFLPDKSREGQLQGTDKVIRVRDYRLMSIREFVMGGEHFVVDKA